MKKCSAILLLVFALSTVQAQQIPTWKITDVEKYIEQGTGIMVINFWATFCKPCVAEIPFFIEETSKFSKDSLSLLLVSLDLPSYYPQKISSFAKSHKFTVPIVWLNETNADYFCPAIDKSWSGSIPATLIINKNTGYRKFYEEEFTHEEFTVALKLAGER